MRWGEEQKSVGPIGGCIMLGDGERALHDDLRVLSGVCGMGRADIYGGARPWRPL